MTATMFVEFVAVWFILVGGTCGLILATALVVTRVREGLVIRRLARTLQARGRRRAERGVPMIALAPCGRVVLVAGAVFLLLAFDVIPGLVHTLVRRNREDAPADVQEDDRS